jgi:feruloyl esterase
VGSEPQWPAVFIPHAGNHLTPYALVSGTQVIGYRFYAEDPGRMPPDLANVKRHLDTRSLLPEWGWWTFSLDDLDDPDKRTPVYELMQGDDADLAPFLIDRGGKLLMFHGWADAVIPPGPTVDYYDAVVAETFDGNAADAAEHVRLYGVPGMGHCRGGPGPQPDYRAWLESLVAWVEDGRRPEAIVGRVVDGDEVVNERPLCPYPTRAVYTGPPASRNEPSSWRAENFECR